MIEVNILGGSNDGMKIGFSPGYLPYYVMLPAMDANEQDLDGTSFVMGSDRHELYLLHFRQIGSRANFWLPGSVRPDEVEPVYVSDKEKESMGFG